MASRTPKYDAKVKAILDTTKPGERVCELTGEKWEMTEEEISWYKKFNVPPSKWAPRVRMRLLQGFTSGIALWWKKHANTKNPILSFVHPDSPYQVITDKEWMSEEFLHAEPQLDSGQPFFDQFRKLSHSVPVGALRDDGSSRNTIGVDYIKSEDCYMIFSQPETRRCMYVAIALFSDDCVDATNTHNSQFCYSSNRATKMYKCWFAFESRDCINSSFLFDCRNCENCFGATNKRNKKYLWFNEQLTQGEYEKRVAEVDLSCYSKMQEYKQKFQALVKDAVWPENFNIGATESTGEYLEEVTRCHDSFWVRKSNDLYTCWMMEDVQDAAFSVWSGWANLTYYTCDTVSSSWLRYCFRCWHCQNMEYCTDCYNCENCFGCAGLRKKSFCILNVQYSEDEYWKKLDEIKSAMLDRGEYGEFFSAEFSQNGLEYSMADIFMGFSEAELKAYDAPRFDPTRGGVVLVDEQADQVGTPIEEVPDCIADVDAKQFVGQPLYDSEINRNFSVTEKEFAYYQREGLAFPRQHFLTRLKNLIRTANSPIPEQATCHECQKTITTFKNMTYSDRQVLCKPCYLKYLEKYG